MVRTTRVSSSYSTSSIRQKAPPPFSIAFSHNCAPKLSLEEKNQLKPHLLALDLAGFKVSEKKVFDHTSRQWPLLVKSGISKDLGTTRDIDKNITIIKSIEEYFETLLEAAKVAKTSEKCLESSISS